MAVPPSTSDAGARLRQLRNMVEESRGAFETFLLQADYLVRFSDELLRRSHEIRLPAGPRFVELLKRSPVDAGRRPQAPAPARPQRGDVGGARPATASPLTILVGPVDRLAEIEDLMARLEADETLDVRFRLFRAGLYRIDAICSDTRGLAETVRLRRDVVSVTLESSTLHVVPAPATL